MVTIPVSDIDRAKEFYGETLGWRLDTDFSEGDRRVVQLTPPGSPASIHFGAGRTSATPGSAQGMFLVVSDIQAARDELLERGVEVSEIFHADGGPLGDPVGGPAPDHQSYGSLAALSPHHLRPTASRRAADRSWRAAPVRQARATPPVVRARSD